MSPAAESIILSDVGVGFPHIPNDDERGPSFGDGNVMASSCIDSSPRVNEVATFATQTNNGDEPQTLRKSSRVSNLPSKFTDFILPSNKKYGIEKHVNYSKLSTINFFFATKFNKSVKPKSYDEAA
ncbi:hypothetical protein Tco_0859005 [Tanacetum coccineum]|uniref:Uncharacterized protein n=1 Tax=Tanacetum coccineum TaxID=301880 RepID=A0ABQ5BBR7_9ASTR